MESYIYVLPPQPHLDVKAHLLLLHRQVLPLFFLLCALTMIVFIAIRAGKKGANIPDADFVGAPVGLLSAKPGEAFDPDFAVLSPIEMAKAPLATLFDEVAALPDHEARALTDGWVALVAEDRVILVHALTTGIFETVYSGLANARVRVGALVTRGEVLGRFRAEDSASSPIQITIRNFPGLSIPDGDGARVPLPKATGTSHAAPRARSSEASAMKVEIPSVEH